MPSSLIEVRRPYGPQDQVGLIDAVHGALVAAFKIPQEDRYVRVLTYDAHAMVNGPGPGVPDTYTRVTIDCFAGRTIDAKRELYREIVKRLELLGIPREHVSILPYFGLASGFLTGKYRSAADKSKSPRGGGMDKYLDAKGLGVLAALDAVAARRDATCAQVALAWIMAKPAIAAPIASATSVAQVTELMGALRVNLSAADVAELDEASA